MGPHTCQWLNKNVNIFKILAKNLRRKAFNDLETTWNNSLELKQAMIFNIWYSVNKNNALEAAFTTQTLNKR